MADAQHINTRVGHYIRLRDWLASEKEKYEARVKGAKQEMEKIEGELSAFMKETGLKNGATPSGSFYATQKNTASINDKSQFRRFVIGGELWDLIDIRANANEIDAFAKENNGELPPGVTFDRIEVIHVNRPR